MNNLRNQVQLIGHIGAEVELKTFDTGMMLAKAPLATNEYYRNNKGEKVQDTQWHKVVAWGKTAEFMNQQLKKGDEVALSGKLVHRKYQDGDGRTQYITEIVVNEFMKLGTREKS